MRNKKVNGEMEKEKQQQLSLFSSSCCCISHVFQRAASSNPNKIALIQATKRHKNLVVSETNHDNVGHHLFPPVYEGDQCFTFSQLLSAIDSFSNRLYHILNGGDDPSLIRPTSGNDSHKNLNFATKILGVFMVPSVEYVITVLSILRCGCVFLPLDASWPKERILSIISSSNVELIIGCLSSDQKSGAHLLNKSHWLLNSCKIPSLCISIDGILEQKFGALDLVWPCESRGSRQFSYLIYTSGSTGKPKGVCVTEEGVLNRFIWMQELYPLEGDEILLFKTSISFVDHLQEFLAPMLAGCTLIVPPFNELKENLLSLVDFLHDYSITRITAVPSLIRALLPALGSLYSEGVQCSLKLLVLSGEVFPIPLWRTLSRILPKTSILNIYGSTEVSGDSTYFDCKRLLVMLEYNMLSSVPIGVPLSNCNVKLIEEDGKWDEGEICVAGVCLASGYYSEGNVTPLDYVQLTEDSVSVDNDQRSEIYYRTGDFARRLPSGELVFLGRKDRTVKVNGQRISLEEVEETLRGHPDVADAAVVFCNEQEGHALLGAVVVLKNKSSEISKCIKSWMADRLPSAMIPKEIICTEEIPMTSTGKVNYTLLASYFPPVNGSNEGHVQQTKTVEQIKEAFGNALDVAEVGNDDDFFVLGGDSIIAAHVAHKLGTDMRLLYMFPTPSKLQKALMEKEDILKVDGQINWETLRKAQKGNLLPSSDSRSNYVRPRKLRETMWTESYEQSSSKHFKMDSSVYSNPKFITSANFFPWESHSTPTALTLSRCNKLMCNSDCEFGNLPHRAWEVELPGNSKGFLREVWRVPMDSCVDASPLVALKDEEILVFIGSHSHKFLCVNARDGLVRWEIKLEGRIECSAVMDGDFSQVVVGCYQGKIYFIDMVKGNTNWTFQTGGEVKSQPTVDKCRHLVWCGSHDHNLYGLDYRSHLCVYQFPCGGTIFGSPAIDEVRDILYIGTTNGLLTAITLKASAFSTLWLLELEAPIFGSLSISSNGNVICGVVSGDVLSVDPRGSIVWRVNTDGPIFAGPCISTALSSQVLVCSRNGRVYSLDEEKGNIMWEYNAKDPITSSAYVDDNIKLISDPSLPSERLVCICTSSGSIHLLKVSCITTKGGEMPKEMVKKFAELDLQGEIFSSPVMVVGQIIVGCRDDYLHCIATDFVND